jgi:Uma2 family endonuclease
LALPALKEEIKFTYQDYLNLPDDGKRYQIIGGELFMVPAPTPYHQKILVNLSQIIVPFIRKNDLGEVFFSPCDVLISDEDVIQPDMFFIKKERLEIIKEKNIQQMPDLIIEITSMFTSKLDKTIKKMLYEKYKVKEY